MSLGRMAMARRLVGVLACWSLALLLSGALVLWPGASPAFAKPNVPQGVSAQAGGRQLTISWLVLSDDGWGGPIDNYVITVITPSNQVLTKYSTTSPVTFTGLRHGTHQYYVGAHNADGWGHTSPIAKISVPSEPDRMAVPHASSVKPDTLTVTWTPPNSDGLGVITAWGVLFDGTEHVEPANARQATYFALGGTEHTVRVRAKNRWGWGDYSGTHYAHARGYPGPVASVTATATDTTISVTWQPPAKDGGRPVDHYVVRVFTGAVSQEKPGAKAGDRVDFAGLTPDIDYRVSVAVVGYDPDDGLGILTGPAFKVMAHTLPAGSSASPTVVSASGPPDGSGAPGGAGPSAGVGLTGSPGASAGSASAGALAIDGGTPTVSAIGHHGGSSGLWWVWLVLGGIVLVIVVCVGAPVIHHIRATRRTGT